MTLTKALYPLKFDPIYKDKVWGGRELAKFGKKLPPDLAIGESWELADLATTSTSGGGGNPERSIVTNGLLAGQSLAELIETYGSDLLGQLPLTDDGGFPLLVKYLDAREHLSVQVHPSPSYAAAHADAFLKSECWYIVSCEPGAVIYKGVKAGTTPELFAKAIESNTVEELMIAIPVKPGDMHYLPSGTCHALGAGIVVAEVQTPSDTTYRVYDWGRTGRELHVEQALACIDFGPCQTEADQPGPLMTSHGISTQRLVKCEYFQVDRITYPADHTGELPIDQPRVWMVLAGKGEIDVPTPAGAAAITPVTFRKAETLLLPPTPDRTVLRIDEPTTLLQVTFPQTMADLIA